MPIDKYDSENMKIAGVVKVLSNAFADYDDNIKRNEELSKDLDEFIGKMERGEIPSSMDFTFLLNNAMERTKSDPEADKGKYDTLRETGQIILDIMKIPADLIHANLLINLLKEFQNVLLGSQRRHFHYRDEHWHQYVDRIFSSFEIINPTSVYPAFNNMSSKKQKKKKKKISFR